VWGERLFVINWRVGRERKRKEKKRKEKKRKEKFTTEAQSAQRFTEKLFVFNYLNFVRWFKCVMG